MHELLQIFTQNKKNVIKEKVKTIKCIFELHMHYKYANIFPDT